MNQQRTITPALVAAHATNRAAIAAALLVTEQIELHRREQVATFANIARIAGMVDDSTGLIQIDRLKLALGYAMDALELADTDRVETLESECGVDSEFGWEYCELRDAFKREFGL